MSQTRALTWSYGGGTESVAIAVLVSRGELPFPECVVIADTGREGSETWEYTDAYVRPLLATKGIEIEVVPHSLATVDLYSKKGELLIPAWTKPNGQMSTFCSVEWKRRPVARFLRQRGYGPKKPVDMWIGISIDEWMRAKGNSGVAWQSYLYPLIDLHISRDDCKRIVMDAGLPEPPKSSCWMCPWRSEHQFARLRDRYPDDYTAAIQLDQEIRDRDTDHNVFLLKSRIPLGESSLSNEQTPVSTDTGEVEACDSGMCWV